MPLPVGHHEVLGAEWQPAQKALERPQAAERAGEEYAVAMPNGREPRSETLPAKAPRSQQSGVFVEGTRVHRMHRQWIEWVVLEDDEHPAIGQHSPGFREYRLVLDSIDVMEHASHEHEIEASVGEGDARSVEMN